MAKVVKLNHTGGPEVLHLVEAHQTDPGPGEVWVEQEAVGVNYLDVMQRLGTAPLALPNGLGLEAAGRVLAVGPGVADIVVGDRVAYILGPIGAYATGRLYPANRLIKLPELVTADEAAAILFKGITAQYLIKSTYAVREGTIALVYGAAGGVGQILVPWAKHLGARVIGVVSKAESVELAEAAGCDDVLVWGDDIAERVTKITAGQKADVVYDGVGKTTFTASLDSLRPRGMLVSIGASSGSPPAVEFSTLNAKGSLYVTRPGLAAHATDLEEYKHRARDVFDAVATGIIKAQVTRTYPLSQVASAHAVLERGEAKGTILLKP